MFIRFAFSAAAIFCLSTSAFANCAPCQPAHNSAAYSLETQNGVTIMRGNMPNIQNPRNSLIAERNAAQARADDALTRARRAEREAANASAVLAARAMAEQNSYDYQRRYNPQYNPLYNSGRYGYGASISRARVGRHGQGYRGRGTRGRGFGGRGTGVSRPVFTTRIRG